MKVRGGGWQLNNLPNFSDELMRCQRYLNVVRANNVWSMFGFAYAVSSTMGAAFVPLGVPLRASPTVTVDGDVQMAGNAGSVTIDSVTNDNWSSNGVRLRLNVPDGGLTPDALYQFRAQGNNAKIIFDANL